MKKSLKYAILAVIIVALCGMIFVMAQTSVNGFVKQTLDEFDAVVGTDLADNLVGADIESAKAGNNGGWSSTYSSWAASTGNLAWLYCYNGDSDSASKWNGSCSCSSSFSAYDTQYIYFGGDISTAIANRRVTATLYVQINSDNYDTSGGDGLDSNWSARSISASGGMSGSHGSMAQRPSSATYTLAGYQTLTGTITLSASTSGEARASRSKKTFRTVSCSTYCNGAINTSSIYLSLGFNNVSIGFAPTSTTYGSVSSTSATLTTPSATASSTATAKTGYYFTGWSGVTSYRTMTTSKGCNYGSSSANYSATFASFPGSASATSFTYTGSGQAPTISVSGYTASYTYSGTTNAGASYNRSSKPTEAGSYKMVATLTNNTTGEYAGTSNAYSFTINKANVSLTTTASHIEYGQTNSVSVLTISARHSSTGAAVYGSYAWVYGGNTLALGNNTCYYNFTPNISGNYYYNYNALTNQTVNVVADNMLTLTKVDSLTLAGAETSVSNSVAFNSNNGKVVGNKAQVSVTATPTYTSNYCFIGWKKNGTYVSSDLTYTYSMASADERRATLQAVFVKINIDGLQGVSAGVFQMTKPFTNSATVVNVGFSLIPEDYGFAYSAMTYNSGSTFPISIGSYTANFSISNTVLGTTVFNPQINIYIVSNDISVNVDTSNSEGYNASTGWGKVIYYRLSITGVAKGGVEYYEYSADNGATWASVINYLYGASSTSTAPLSSTGCTVLFKAASASGNETYIKNYLFRAVNNTHGEYYGGATSGNKYVADSDAVACKIDSIVPTIKVTMSTASAANYAGAWTNNDVTFKFELTFGGSGAIVEFYTEGGNENNYSTTGKGAFNYGSTMPAMTATYTWTLTAEQMTNYYFRVNTGTNYTVDFGTAQTVKIDKTAPIIGEKSIDKYANSNGWISETATASFNVTDTLNWAPITAISVNNGGVLTINGANAVADYENACALAISDYKIYAVTATDAAGNSSTANIQVKVDTKVPEISVSEDSYKAGTWRNDSADFNVLAALGASGAKFYYRMGNNVDFIAFGEDVFSYGADSSAAFQTVSDTISFAEAMNKELYFKVVSGSGLESEYDFGRVRLDYTAPTITSLTNMPFYQKADTWRSQALAVSFYVLDDASGVNTDIGTGLIIDNGGVIVSKGLTTEGYDGFGFTIDKCTVYTVAAKDIAGNVTEFEFWANVDLGVPEMEYKAYIGTTNTEYDFTNWINRTIYGDDAYVRFEFTITCSPSKAQVQYMTASGTWKELTGFLCEEGNENALVQTVHYTKELKEDQNSPYRIKLVTGSGKETETINLGDIKIDSTLPSFRMEPKYVNAADITEVMPTFKTEWTYNVVRARFIPRDDTAGIASMSVKRYAVADTAFANGTAVELLLEDALTGYYYFDMPVYANYVITLTDAAGNIYTYDYIHAMVDTTDGFSMTTAAKLGAEDFVSAQWLFDEGDVVVFSFDISFAEDCGYTQFGASGGGVQFSLDGGKTWQTEMSLIGGTQGVVVNNTDALKATMTFTLQQMTTIRFRVASGANRAYSETADYKIYKDTVNPSLDYEVNEGDIAYDGDWSANDLTLAFDATVGASKGSIQVAVSDTAIADITAAGIEWTTLHAIGQCTNGSFETVITETVDAKYYYFRIVNGTGMITNASAPVIIKTDRENLTPSFRLNYADGSLYSTAWAGAAIYATLNDLTATPSGYKVYYATVDIGEIASDLSFTEITSNGGKYSALLNASEQKDVILKVINGAGVVFAAGTRTYRIDLVVPTYEISETCDNVYDDNSVVWNLADVDIAFNGISSGASGGTAQYSIKTDGVWGDWTSEKLNEWNEMVLSDESEAGGTVYDIRFRVVSGAGLYSTVSKTISIDDNLYSPEVKQMVGKTQGYSYAKDVEGLSDYKRGDNLRITFGVESGYTLRSVRVLNAANVYTGLCEISEASASGDCTYDYSGIDMTDGDVLNISCGGADIIIYFDFIKDVELEYGGLQQYLQAAAIAPIDVSVNEYGFDTTYAADNVKFNVSYGGSNELPNGIGVYALNVTTDNDSFNILNPNALTSGGEAGELILTVYYFTGEGSSLDPYAIYDYEDLSYIDSYMSGNTAYDFLGEGRKHAEFELQNDIELPSDFAPLCAAEADAFSGMLDGNDCKIYYDGAYSVNGSFALIGFAKYATISNLSVAFDMDISGANDSNVAFIVADGYAAIVMNSSVYGNVTAVDSANVNLGGVVAYTSGAIIGEQDDFNDSDDTNDDDELSNIVYCFSDVHFDITNVSGNFGGILGYAPHLSETDAPEVYVIGCYTVSQIVVSNDNYVRLLNYHVGAYIGQLDKSFSAADLARFQITDANNYYLANSVFVDNNSLGNIGIGNEGSMPFAYSVIWSYAEFLDSSTYVGDANAETPNEKLYVSALARVRIEDYGFVTDGSEAMPFAISEADDLKLLAVFPWAHFVQTNDIVLEDGFITIAVNVPFMGVYDGNEKTLSLDGDLVLNENYGGIFAQLDGATLKDLTVLNISINASVSGTVIAGGVVGVAQEGSTISNVLASGSITLNSTYVYVGGIVGVVGRSQIKDCIALVDIKVAAGVAYAGGIAAQVQGESVVNNVISISEVNANYTSGGYAGSSIGNILNYEVSGSKIYTIAKSTYVNGRLLDATFGFSNGSISAIYNDTYNNTVNVATNVVVNNSAILDIIGGLYPFESGTGTTKDPFIVVNEEQLAAIGKYMYASFKLGANITVSESFTTIGGTSAFNGTLIGNSYTISGLTDSLFYINNGSISDVVANVDYEVYAAGSNIPIDAKNPKLSTAGETVVFGAIAKYNYAGGSVISVTVGGNIVVQVADKGKAKIGGVVGVDYGGTVTGALSSATVTVKAMSADVGGIIGTIDSNNTSAQTAYVYRGNYAMTVVTVNGTSVKAGLTVGAVRYDNITLETSLGAVATNSDVIVNGVSKGSTKLIGYDVR